MKNPEIEQDLMLYGTAFEIDGKRVDPARVKIHTANALSSGSGMMDAHKAAQNLAEEAEGNGNDWEKWCKPLLDKILAALSAQTANQEPDRDWQEDFDHENGQYYCICCDCGEQFKGHKRRVICKACAHPTPSRSAAHPGLPGFLHKKIEQAILDMENPKGMQLNDGKERPARAVSETRDEIIKEVAESFIQSFRPDDRLEPAYIADCILCHKTEGSVYRALPRQAIPEGYAIVPIIPSAEQWKAGAKAGGVELSVAAKVYSAMVLFDAASAHKETRNRNFNSRQPHMDSKSAL